MMDVANINMPIPSDTKKNDFMILLPSVVLFDTKKVFNFFQSIVLVKEMTT